jgi:type IV pilus biogenesis protein CpaD/CtpE
MTKSQAPTCLLLSLGLLLAGCDGDYNKEPYQRTDVWYPTGANAGNIAAQAVNPYDLIRGRHSDQPVNSGPEAAAVNRVLQDHPKALVGAPGDATSGGSGGVSGGTSGGTN